MGNQRLTAIKTSAAQRPPGARSTFFLGSQAPRRREPSANQRAAARRARLFFLSGYWGDWLAYAAERLSMIESLYGRLMRCIIEFSRRSSR